MSDKQELSNTNPSGPRVVNGLTITIDRDLCIGAATCLAIAPEVFELDNEAKAIILEGTPDVTQAAILDAARACPTSAISIKDETGKALFP